MNLAAENPKKDVITYIRRLRDNWLAMGKQPTYDIYKEHLVIDTKSSRLELDGYW